MTQPSSAPAPIAVSCPFCGTRQIKRDGYTIKGFQRFCCYICQRYWQDAYVRPHPRKPDPQRALFNWARAHPHISRYLIAVPNAGCRRPKEAEKRLAQGFSLNVADILLAYPHQHYHGLWIEFAEQPAHPPTPSLSLARSQWILSMRRVGYQVALANGWEDAAQKIEDYLT